MNNLSESFNASIVEAKEMPIIQMFEYIRKKTMTRMSAKRQGISGYDGEVYPNILSRLEKVKAMSRSCITIMSDRKIFEVTNKAGSYVFNLDTRECTYRLFQLVGYPCRHAVAAIQVERGSMLKYVHVFYSKSIYAHAYSPVLYPIPSSLYWISTNHPVIRPPDARKQIGRPKKTKEEGA